MVELKIDLGNEIDYINGQFINFVFTDSEWIIQRTYSIVERNETIYTFLIKIWTWRWSSIIKNTKVWDNLWYTHISWEFHLQSTLNQKVFIASWTWLAPIYNMLISLNNDIKKILYFWVRTKKDLFYIEKLKNIKNLELKIYLSKQEDSLYNFWRIDLNDTYFSKQTEFYICWNPWLLNDTKKVLSEKWFEKIYFEDYLV